MNRALELVRGAAEPAPASRTPNQALVDLTAEVLNREMSVPAGAYTVHVGLDMFSDVQLSVRSRDWGSYHVDVCFYTSRSQRGTYPKLRDPVNNVNVVGELHNQVWSWKDLLRNAIRVAIPYAEKQHRALLKMQKQQSKLNRPTAAAEPASDAFDDLYQRFSRHVGRGSVHVVQGYDVHIYTPTWTTKTEVLIFEVAPSSTRGEPLFVRNWEGFSLFPDRDGWSFCKGSGGPLSVRIEHIHGPYTRDTLLRKVLELAVHAVEGKVEAAAETLLQDDSHRPTPNDNLRKRLKRLGSDRKITYKGHKFEIWNYNRTDSCVIIPRPAFPNANGAVSVQWDLYENHPRRGPEYSAWLSDNGPLHAVKKHTSLRPRVDVGRRPDGRPQALREVLDEKTWIEEESVRTDADFIKLLLQRSEPLLQGRGFYVHGQETVAAAEPVVPDPNWLGPLLDTLSTHIPGHGKKVQLTSHTCLIKFSSNVLDIAIDDVSVLWFLRRRERYTEHRYVADMCLFGVNQKNMADKTVWQYKLPQDPQHLLQVLVHESLKLVRNSYAHAAAEPEPAGKRGWLQPLLKIIDDHISRAGKKVTMPGHTCIVKSHSPGMFTVEIDNRVTVWVSEEHRRDVMQPGEYISPDHLKYEVCLVGHAGHAETKKLWEFMLPQDPNLLVKRLVQESLKLIRSGYTQAAAEPVSKEGVLARMFAKLEKLIPNPGKPIQVSGHKYHVTCFTGGPIVVDAGAVIGAVTVVWCKEERKLLVPKPGKSDVHVHETVPCLVGMYQDADKKTVLWESMIPEDPNLLIKHLVQESVKLVGHGSAHAAAEPESADTERGNNRAAYRALVELARRKPVVGVLGARMQVASSSIRDSDVKVMLRMTSGSDEYKLELYARNYDERISVRFDVRATGRARKTFYVPGHKLKPDQVKNTVTEIVRVCGLHEGAHSALVKLDRREIAECAEAIAIQFLRDISDTASPEYNEEENTPVLDDNYTYEDLDQDSVNLTLKLARDFYTIAAPAIEAFVTRYGPQYRPDPADVGYYIGYNFQDSSSIGFVDMNKPHGLDYDAREAWDTLMEELDDAAEAVTGQADYIDGAVVNNKVHFKLVGGTAHAAAEPSVPAPTGLWSMLKHLYEQGHNQPIPIRLPGHTANIQFSDQHRCWVSVDRNDDTCVLFTADNQCHRTRGHEPVLIMNRNRETKKHLLWQSDLPTNPKALMQRLVAEAFKLLQIQPHAEAAAEPKPAFDITNREDVAQELCRRCHGKPVSDDEFDIGPFINGGIGVLTVRVCAAPRLLPHSTPRLVVELYLFNEFLGVAPVLAVESEANMLEVQHRIQSIHARVRALAKAAPDLVRFRADVTAYAQGLEHKPAEYGEDPSGYWNTELADFWKKLRAS